MYIYIYIYISVEKTLSSFMLSLQRKNESFLYFHSSIFNSKIHKHPAFKMNRDEQGGLGQKFEAIIWSQKICHYFFAFTGRCMNALALSLTPSNEVKNLKFWLDIIFGWSWSFFPATKIYILTFNLIHSLISLMGSFHFPQWKIFFPIHWFIVWNVTILFYVTPYLIFNRVKLQLGHKLSQFIHRFNI